MKLRFEVNQAEAFRRGVDCPKSIVSVEVDPATLDSQTREIIAKRLRGIDVCEIFEDGQPVILEGGSPARIVAALPTLEELIRAVEKSEFGMTRQEARAVSEHIDA